MELLKETCHENYIPISIWILYCILLCYIEVAITERFTIAIALIYMLFLRYYIQLTLELLIHMKERKTFLRSLEIVLHKFYFFNIEVV